MIYNVEYSDYFFVKKKKEYEMYRGIVGSESCIRFFFFKQNTAYEMLRSLVGSEMCIRDRTTGVS